jgi:hypothetical protein
MLRTTMHLLVFGYTNSVRGDGVYPHAMLNTIATAILGTPNAALFFVDLPRAAL